MLNLCFIALAFAGAWFVTGLMRRYSPKLRLVQAPNHRSLHATPTPHGGGLGIVAGSLLAAAGLVLTGGAGAPLAGIFGLALLLAVIGLADDIDPLPASVRFMIQLVVCMALVWIIFPPVPVSFPLPLLWPLLLLLAGVWWLNVFNFMDGIDGLAASQAIFMLLAAAWFSAVKHPAAMAMMPWWSMLAVAAAAAGFLLHNWPPAKIFMGDAGSLFLAFMLLALAFFSVREGWMHYGDWLILGAVFITDATVTLFNRLRWRQRWFEAHRLHAYQKLAQRWGSHRRVTLAVMAVNLLWLLPLACSSIRNPAHLYGDLALAYLPLIAIALFCKAGKPEDA